VRAHVLLEVEVGKLISLVELKKSGKLVVRVDLATVVLVLKVVGADVLVDLTSDISASHLSTSGLLKELGELIRDASRLHEARRGAVARLSLALGIGLLGGLKLTSPLLLKSTVLRAKRSNSGAEIIKLREELNRLSGKSCLNILSRDDILRSGGGSRDSRNSLSLGSTGLLGLYLNDRGRSRSRSRGRGRGSSGSRGSLRGSIILLDLLSSHCYILFKRDFFLSGLIPKYINCD